MILHGSAWLELLILQFVKGLAVAMEQGQGLQLRLLSDAELPGVLDQCRSAAANTFNFDAQTDWGRSAAPV